MHGKTKMKVEAVLDRLQYEKRAQGDGFHAVAGLDEAGRGPLAGPVVAASVILPDDLTGLEGVTDSKKLTAGKRREFFMLLHERAREIGVGVVDAQTIDRINILQATFLAMHRAVESLRIKPDYLLIDGNRTPAWATAAKTIVSGEMHSLSIAAASIIAKEIRDRIMLDYDHIYPHWGFASHKGYGTAKHMEAIRLHGICDIHRRTFDPIPQMTLDVFTPSPPQGNPELAGNEGEEACIADVTCRKSG
ncbi:ribonuclease HII [candidate division FCPU426 bacterium]|nr:ribonuclease HII [candidate division FCPU426 bacterium]